MCNGRNHNFFMLLVVETRLTKGTGLFAICRYVFGVLCRVSYATLQSFLWQQESPRSVAIFRHSRHFVYVKHLIRKTMIRREILRKL